MDEYIFKWRAEMFSRFTIYTPFYKFDKDEVLEVRKQMDGSWLIILKNGGTSFYENGPIQVIAIP
jgi:hypothetical protein